MPGSREHTLTAPLHDPLMAVLIEANGVTETQYFTEAMRADALPVGEDGSSPVKLAGVWSDLDADDMLDSLDRARHATKPTSPIADIP
jgi:hypothetical protein